MSVTLQTVLEKLGDSAQLTGGRIVVLHNGKHVDVGGISMTDAVFSLTAAGIALLETIVPTEKTTKSTGKSTKQTKTEGDVDLSALDSTIED